MDRRSPSPGGSARDRRSLAGTAGAVTMEIMHKKELADFLRRRRETLQPGDVGLSPARAGAPEDYAAKRSPRSPACPPTTTPGSNSSAARSPPSRSPPPSPARLRLTLDERDHLFGLIGHNAPARFHHSEHVSPTLLRVLDRLHDSPALVLTDLADILAQNPLSVALTRRPDPPHRPGPQRLLPLVHRPGRTPVLSRGRPPAPRPHPRGPPARRADDRQRHPPSRPDRRRTRATQPRVRQHLGTAGSRPALRRPQDLRPSRTRPHRRRLRVPVRREPRPDPHRADRTPRHGEPHQAPTTLRHRAPAAHPLTRQGRRRGRPLPRGRSRRRRSRSGSGRAARVGEDARHM